MTDKSPPMPPHLAIIIPAHNEAAYIGACLSALFASVPLDGDGAEIPAVETVVVCNACTDATARIARDHAAGAAALGWRLTVLETAAPGKLNALNLGEAASPGRVRIYLDADVIVSPALIGQLYAALDTPDAAYASGTAIVSPPRSALTRAYARFWTGLPFVTDGVPGFGIFALNAAGRSRWGVFPDIISDDTFVRLHFAAEERIGVPAAYSWPMVEGFGNLLRVRRRQDAGVAEIARLYPHLLANNRVRRPGIAGLLRRLVRDPVAFCTYALVSLAVRLPGFGTRHRWARGR